MKVAAIFAVALAVALAVFCLNAGAESDAGAAPGVLDIPGVPGEDVTTYRISIPADAPAGRPPPAMELGRSRQAIGRATAAAAVQAEVWIAGRSAPVYQTVTIAPGTWLLPSEMYESPIMERVEQ